MSELSAFQKAKLQASVVQPPPLPWAVPGKVPRVKLPPPLPARIGGEGKKLVLDLSDLEPFKNLLLFAKLVVQGWFAGRHRSIDYGSNAEFAEHKPYVPGDPVAMIDWKVYARSRRIVVRKHREEKDMTGYLVVDVSGSMAYEGAGRESKQVRAARVAASLAVLMQWQGDKSALALFHESLDGFVPPGSTRRHLHDLVSLLEKAVSKPGGGTRAHSALDLCLPLFKKRGSLVVISDFFTDQVSLFDALAQYQHRGFEVLLLHVIDPDERHLPDVALARFVDMETGTSIQVSPDEIRIAYQREMEAMTEALCEESQRRGIHYQVLRTEDPYLEAIQAWLGLRGKLAKGQR